MSSIAIPSPQLQIDFSFALAQIRGLYLQEALLETVEKMDIAGIDRELNKFVPKQSLKAVARHGLRGELVFPVPCILAQNPQLLGYYRLLFGYSQKIFYTSKAGLIRYKSMEEKGGISREQMHSLPDLCTALVQAAVLLVDGIGVERISRGFLDDLTLLTLGPQFRGGRNNKIGTAGIFKVFEIIQNIVCGAAINSTLKRIEIRNAAGRKVLIEFAPDPDIIIREEMDKGSYRKIIAIEIKAGTDSSNIYNRLGEAEKSHQKARKAGYHECWTVVNVDKFDLEKARDNSPSSNRFYSISKLMKKQDEEYHDFRNRIVSLTGIMG